MPNQFGAPEISVEEVAELRSHQNRLTLLDVREPMELKLANLGDDAICIPLSELARARENAIPGTLQDKETEIVVFCHTGVRSAQVTAWLRSLGWRSVWSMAGGIDAYARRIDSNIGTY
jgi:rhodanese-related sulfurtransferase